MSSFLPSLAWSYLLIHLPSLASYASGKIRFVLPDGRVYSQSFFQCFQFCENPESPLHNMQKTTQVVVIRSKDGKVLYESLNLQMMDPDGDHAFMYGEAVPGKNALMRFTGGTGKFEGITGEYRTASAGTSWPDGSQHFPGEIDWKIPDR